MMNRIFIGYDPRQPVSYAVLHHSIIARTSKPVTIAPLKIETLPLQRQGLTPFTFSRFLVPWLCGFEGWALFLDADEIVLADIAELFGFADESKAVMASLNVLAFERASVMLFNCGHPDNAKLTPAFIETSKGLHTLNWTPAVGDLPREWNHLVGYDVARPDAKLVHFTQGVPAWPETADCEHAAAWRKEAQTMISAEPWEKLMGPSVHAAPVRERLAKRAA